MQVYLYTEWATPSCVAMISRYFHTECRYSRPDSSHQVRTVLNRPEEEEEEEEERRIERKNSDRVTHFFRKKGVFSLRVVEMIHFSACHWH